jgi:hypothetical protein
MRFAFFLVAVPPFIVNSQFGESAGPSFIFLVYTSFEDGSRLKFRQNVEVMVRVHRQQRLFIARCLRHIALLNVHR